MVLGTAAFADGELLDHALAQHGERIVVSVDTRGGRVATAGWTETASLTALDAVALLLGAARRALHHPHRRGPRDGMLEGVDAAAVARIADAVLEGRAPLLGAGSARSPTSRRSRRCAIQGLRA